MQIKLNTWGARMWTVWDGFAIRGRVSFLAYARSLHGAGAGSGQAVAQDAEAIEAKLLTAGSPTTCGAKGQDLQPMPIATIHQCGNS